MDLETDVGMDCFFTRVSINKYVNKLTRNKQTNKKKGCLELLQVTVLSNGENSNLKEHNPHQKKLSTLPIFWNAQCKPLTILYSC